MVPLGLGDIGDAVDERHRLDEVRESELALECTVDHRPTVGVPFGHTASMQGRSDAANRSPAPCVLALGQSSERSAMRRSVALALVGILTIAVVAVGSAQGSSSSSAVKTLTGTVGPGFTITMSKRTVKAGMFRITIRDRSSIHNFHLTGPGVNKRTSVGGTGTTTWTVRLRKGKTYRFVCDPHASSMKGTLRVT
jgi:plastocyanin